MQNKTQSLKIKNENIQNKHKNKIQNVNLKLHFNSFVYDDISLSLKHLNLFAFKLSQSLKAKTMFPAFEQVSYDKMKSNFNVKSASISNMGACQGLDVVKTLNFLYVASKRKFITPKKHIITVLRSPFVYKKTREQFAFQRYNVKITLTLKRSTAEFLLPMLSQLRLPAELKIRLR